MHSLKRGFVAERMRMLGVCGMTALGQQETNRAPFLRVRTWGYSRRNRGENGSRRSNVGCWGWSRRTGGVLRTSADSHKQTLVTPQRGPQFGASRCRWWEPSTASQADIRQPSTVTFDSRFCYRFRPARGAIREISDNVIWWRIPGIGQEKPCGTLPEHLLSPPVTATYMKTVDLE